MCQGENIMEDNRREEKEALKVLTGVQPEIIKIYEKCNGRITWKSSAGYR